MLQGHGHEQRPLPVLAGPDQALPSLAACHCPCTYQSPSLAEAPTAVQASGAARMLPRIPAAIGSVMTDPC